MNIRVGQGFDIHAFSNDPTRGLVLGGVAIPDGPGLVGHSDADVLTHACIDALVGAANLGDIGQLFPDSDPAYAGADSAKLLGEVVKLLSDEGWTVGNIDATVILEQPKLAPHRMEMQRILSSLVGAPVSVKASTAERLGFIGRGEGTAAMAVALICRKNSEE